MDRYGELLDMMRSRKSVLVAFSGGVDSTLVAMAAVEALGENAVLVMFDNETIPRRDLHEAERIARELGASLRIVRSPVLGIEGILANPVDRCGACKRHLMSMLLEISQRENIEVVADGSNADDPSDHRPGLKAADELGIWHPLIEANIGKADARSILEKKGSPVHDRPSTTCMMTRIPYGERVTPEKLAIIELVEDRVVEMGLSDIRLRLFERANGGYLGVLEVDDPIKAMHQWSKVRELVPGVRIALDPVPYRQGSLNDGVELP